MAKARTKSSYASALAVAALVAAACTNGSSIDSGFLSSAFLVGGGGGGSSSPTLDLSFMDALNGWLQTVRVYRVRLSTATLQALTM